MIPRIVNVIRHPRRTARNIFSFLSGSRRRSGASGISRGSAVVEGWSATTHTTPAAPAPSAGNPLEVYFDGVTAGPGVWKWRHYSEIYHTHLSRFVGRQPVVVEIGVSSGGSMSMWHSYFGAGTHVHGIDIEPACRAYATPDTTIHIGDQADATFWREFRQQVPQVDVLIDDGGHEPEQHMATVEAMLPHLRPGGVSICEDITCSGNRFSTFIHALMDGLHAYAPTISPTGNVSPASPFQASIHSLHVYPFVVVIEKRAAPMPLFSAPKHGTQWQPYL
jgi:hypothetical protein